MVAFTMVSHREQNSMQIEKNDILLSSLTCTLFNISTLGAAVLKLLCHFGNFNKMYCISVTQVIKSSSFSTQCEAMQLLKLNYTIIVSQHFQHSNDVSHSLLLSQRCFYTHMNCSHG